MTFDVNFSFGKWRAFVLLRNKNFRFQTQVARLAWQQVAYEFCRNSRLLHCRFSFHYETVISILSENIEIKINIFVFRGEFQARNFLHFFFEIHLTKPANNITLSTMRFFRRETAGYFR